MSLHYGRPVSILQVCCLLLLSNVEALKLSNPPSTFPGDSLAISWTVSEEDPQNFDLKVGFCGGFDTGFLFEQTAISARSSSLRHGTIQKLPSGLETPAQCFVKAFDSDTGQPLDSSSVELLASGSSSLPVTKKTETTVRTVGPPPEVQHTSPLSASLVPAHSTFSSSPAKPSPSSTRLPSPSPSTSHSSPSLSTTPKSQTTTSPLSLTSSLQPGIPPSATSKGTLPTASRSTTITRTSLGIPSSNSASSNNTKRPIGPPLGPVLGGLLAFLLLLSFLTTLCVWRRRRRRRKEREIANPFVPDTGYLQPISKREEIENERSADANGASAQPDQDFVVPVATEKVDLARNNSVGSVTFETRTRLGTGVVVATVEEEVTMLRARLMALEDQHRELTGELRTAVINPPEYSR